MLRDDSAHPLRVYGDPFGFLTYWQVQNVLDRGIAFNHVVRSYDAEGVDGVCVIIEATQEAHQLIVAACEQHRALVPEDMIAHDYCNFTRVVLHHKSSQSQRDESPFERLHVLQHATMLSIVRPPPWENGTT